MKVEFDIDDVGRDPIHNIVYNINELEEKLNKNKLLKDDRELLLQAISIIEELYKNKYK